MIVNEALRLTDIDVSLAEDQHVTALSPRPLLICDADEVLLYFAQAFERYLSINGYTIDFSSFALTGNIRDARGVALDALTVKDKVAAFFADDIESCTPVTGAAASLQRLSLHADIVILTNIPAAQRARREAALAGHGMPYPVFTNEGSKGEAVRALAAGRQAAVAFIDDLPPHHSAVLRSAPHVHRIHMVADERLRRLVPPASDAHVRLDDWVDAQAYLERLFEIPALL